MPLLNLLAVPALAQMPPPGACFAPQANRSTNTNADMAAKNARRLPGRRAALDQLDQQLAGMRSSVDVNNPGAVAQFKQLLEQRDAAAKAAGGPTLTDSQAATERYNNNVNAYNAQCGGRPLPPPPPTPLACP